MSKFVSSKNFNESQKRGGVIMGNVKNLKSLMLVGICAAVLAVCALVPSIAFAAVDYPGYENTDKTGTSAETEVGLKLDQESQLSFTAPTTINFALKADGSFAVPTGAYFKNNSVFKIKVVSYAVTSAEGTTGVADVTDKTSADTYQISVTGNDSTAVPFAISSADTWAGWTLAAAGASASADTCNLTFAGKMVNPTGTKWTSGAKLQDVVWTVAAAA